MGKGGVVREPQWRRGALIDVGNAARELGAEVLGYASSGLPGPKGNLETFIWLADGGRAGVRDLDPRRSRGRTVKPIRTATVFTHRRPAETAPAIGILVELASGGWCTASARSGGGPQA